jgi:hypothetical protein
MYVCIYILHVCVCMCLCVAPAVAETVAGPAWEEEVVCRTAAQLASCTNSPTNYGLEEEAAVCRPASHKAAAAGSAADKSVGELDV